MSGAVPQKIVLKSTTKISLNDRFSTIKPKPPAPTTQQVRATMAAQQQASAKNRRLAQQMANRPSVVAALKIKKRSMKQRLGVNIKSRLSLPQTGQVRGRGRGRGQRGTFQRGGQQQYQRGTGQAVYRQRGASPKRVLRGRGGVRARGALRGRGGAVRGSVARGRGGRGGSTTYLRGRGGQSYNYGGRGRGSGGRGFYKGQRGGQRGNFRGRRGQRGGRGGRGGRGRGQQTSVSKEDLDTQLDAYMAKTKGHLDAELDAYMSQSNMGDE